ncbi:MAG: hypothetical protein NXI27_25600 [Alphaproteobacteria bacterium]|nr:hypothetical protein [Alphaproteobacteria bacterium]
MKKGGPFDRLVTLGRIAGVIPTSMVAQIAQVNRLTDHAAGKIAVNKLVDQRPVRIKAKHLAAVQDTRRAKGIIGDRAINQADATAPYGTAAVGARIDCLTLKASADVTAEFDPANQAPDRFRVSAGPVNGFGVNVLLNTWPGGKRQCPITAPAFHARFGERLGCCLALFAIVIMSKHLLHVAGQCIDGGCGERQIRPERHCLKCNDTDKPPCFVVRIQKFAPVEEKTVGIGAFGCANAFNQLVDIRSAWLDLWGNRSHGQSSGAIKRRSATNGVHPEQQKGGNHGKGDCDQINRNKSIRSSERKC